LRNHRSFERELHDRPLASVRWLVVLELLRKLVGVAITAMRKRQHVAH
jgi:hypothetical protein